MVSIPHRQAKNGLLALCYKNWFPGFQFLIGRLKTTLKAYTTSFWMLFQFLIGRLKTQKATLEIVLNWQFQFLIGRLKTPLRRTGHHREPGFNSS